MNKRIFVAVLAFAVLSLTYYWGFYAPLQEELLQVATRTAAVEAQMADAAGTLAAMNEMEAALAALPADQPGQIAPYDNKAAVLTQLNQILAASEAYSLSFSDPVISADGMVRRSVIMQFRCSDFSALKSIAYELTHSPWRCQISSLSLRATDNIPEGPITASATVTFFESTKLP